jgi:hypothetical protein
MPEVRFPKRLDFPVVSFALSRSLDEPSVRLDRNPSVFFVKKSMEGLLPEKKFMVRVDFVPDFDPNVSDFDSVDSDVVSDVAPGVASSDG